MSTLFLGKIVYRWNWSEEWVWVGWVLLYSTNGSSERFIMWQSQFSVKESIFWVCLNLTSYAFSGWKSIFNESEGKLLSEWISNLKFSGLWLILNRLLRRQASTFVIMRICVWMWWVFIKLWYVAFLPFIRLHIKDRAVCSYKRYTQYTANNVRI